MSAVQHVYRYAQPSVLTGDGGKASLRLAAELVDTPSAAFFDGLLLEPVTTARSLRAVSDLVGTRFYTPPSMLARILREADPVVTVGRDQLRFEGFSACCSTYIRHDIGGDGFAADHVSPGTTNVDFQADMRAALAMVRPTTQLRLKVDRESVALETADDAVVERKVALPVRWIKGFAEVQGHLHAMTQAFTLTRIQAQRFLRGLPRAQADHEQWVVPTAAGVRLSTRAAAGAVMVRGTQRLRVLEALAAAATALEVWFNDKLGSSAWVLDFGTQRLTLTLNAEPWRGFSGDGQLLSGVAAASAAETASVQAQLAWQVAIDPDAVARATGRDITSVRTAMATLAAQGLLGFDLDSGKYFHRELPFDRSIIEALNPRLKSAAKLLEQGAVALERDGNRCVAQVRSGGVTHRVVMDENGTRCTCPWFAKHEGKRGPCKHILAAEMTLDQSV